MSKLLISTQRHDFDSFFDAAEKRAVGLEVQAFTSPDVLDDGWRPLLRLYRQRLAGWKEGKVSLHGAFYDTFPPTPDRRLRQVVRDRYIQCLEIASELSARVVVFHAHYNPFIRHHNYQNTWVERQRDFWSEMVGVAERANLTIALENVWEETPVTIQGLLRAVPSPRFKACLDTGHANIFSKIPVEDWVKIYGADLAHVHLHSNHGEMDEHLSPAKGAMRFEKFFASLDALPEPPQITVEVHEEEAAEEGIDLVRRLSRHGVYAPSKTA